MNKDIRDEAYNVLVNELRRDETGKFYIVANFDDIEYLCSKENISLVKEKIYSLVEKLNSSSEDEIVSIMEADFQEEIWDKI